MTLEDITHQYLIAKSDDAKEMAMCHVKAIFADYVAELFEEMANYVVDLEMGE